MRELIESISLDPIEYIEETTCKESIMWFYCLRQAMKSAAKGDKQDLYWIFRQDMQVGSFSWICDHLDIDLDGLRKAFVANKTHLLQTRVRGLE